MFLLRIVLASFLVVALLVMSGWVYFVVFDGFVKTPGKPLSGNEILSICTQLTQDDNARSVVQKIGARPDVITYRTSERLAAQNGQIQTASPTIESLTESFTYRRGILTIKIYFDEKGNFERHWATDG